MKNQTIKIVGIAVIVALVAFYGGTKYAQGSAQGSFQARAGMNGQTGAATGGFARSGGRTGMGGFVAGTVLSKDASGLTIKLRQGGSVNVLVSTSTAVEKQAAGTLADIAVGQDVTVTGATNADKSVTAQSIQVRPTMAQPSSQQVTR